MNFKATPSQIQSYTLGPVDLGANPVEAGNGESIYIMRPQIPTYLDTNRLSYRTKSGEVKSMLGTRWAEPLAEGIARAMSLYLSEGSTGFATGYYPWPDRLPDASKLSLDFKRFGANDAGDVQIVVNWSLRRSSGISRTGHFVSEKLSWETSRPESLVAAYNQAMKALAREIEQAANQ